MDYKYWNEYYKKEIAPNEPSKFAKDIIGYLKEGKKIVELGCGNGRDAIFFSENKINVLAIDQSESSIKNLSNKYKNNNIEFICDDFIKSNRLKESKFDYVYSRFTIHSISEEEEDVLLHRIYTTLKDDGLLLIEVRSVKDDIYGLGEKIARNTYIYNEHTRRFIVIEELVQKLKTIGFNVILSDESKNHAKYKEQNPIVIRIIAQKQ